MITEAT